MRRLAIIAAVAVAITAAVVLGGHWLGGLLTIGGGVALERWRKSREGAPRLGDYAEADRVSAERERQAVEAAAAAVDDPLTIGRSAVAARLRGDQ